MKAQGFMEDHVNNLKVHKEKLLELVLVLDSLLNESEATISQWKRVELEQAFVEAFQTLANEGIVEFEYICKDNEELNNRLFVIE
jgi:hypothetical protein